MRAWVDRHRLEIGMVVVNGGQTIMVSLGFTSQ